MIKFFTNILSYDLPYLREIFSNEVISNNFTSEPLKKDNVQVIPEDTEVLIISHLCDGSEETLTHFNNLRVVITRSTGFDHIDTEYCKKKNIDVKKH